MSSPSQAPKACEQDIHTASLVIAGVLVPASVVYGILLVVSTQCMTLLWKRRNNPGTKWKIWSIVALLIFATAYFVLLPTSFLNPCQPDKAELKIRMVRGGASSGIFIASDVILLYRCYLVWGGRKDIIAAPFVFFIISVLLICFGTANLGHLAIWDMIFDGWFALTNIIITCLTAARIWLVNRASRRYLDSHIQRRYNLALSLILESGAIIAILLIINFVINIVLLPTKFGQAQQKYAPVESALVKDGNPYWLLINVKAGFVAFQSMAIAVLPIIVLFRVSSKRYDPVESSTNVLRNSHSLSTRPLGERKSCPESSVIVIDRMNSDIELRHTISTKIGSERGREEGRTLDLVSKEWETPSTSTDTGT